MESRKRVDKNIKFFYAANTGARYLHCLTLNFVLNVVHDSFWVYNNNI